MQTKITDKIWQDPDFDELESGEKLAVFWLLTRCNALGWVETNERLFTFQTRLPIGYLEGACNGLSRGLKVFPRGIWIRNFIRRQFGAGPSLSRSAMASSLIKQLADVPSDVKDLILKEYPEILRHPTGTPKGPPRDQGEGEGVREGVGVGAEGSAEGRSEDTQHATAQALELVDTDAKAQTTRQRLQVAEKVYAAYPRKVAKAAAVKAIERALQNGLVDHDELLAAVTEYAAAVRKAAVENEFIPHCATWMNAGRWEDDRAEWTGAGSGGQKKRAGGLRWIRWVRRWVRGRRRWRLRRGGGVWRWSFSAWSGPSGGI